MSAFRLYKVSTADADYAVVCMADTLDGIVSAIQSGTRYPSTEDSRADLISRLETAAQRLDDDGYAQELRGGVSPATVRLSGKAEGVRLALSYIKEGGGK